MTNKVEPQNKITNSKPIPHIPLPFKEVIADVLKVKPPEKNPKKRGSDVTGEICTRWNERESTWRKSGSCPSRGTSQSR
ncbi:MAG: hypothetical protein WBF15_09910, partial [Candidatus Sulfotelmatobacter sp.]